MTSMLPPTRDLPPGRQAQIRGELERAVSGGRSAKRYLVPILAGATAVTAVVTSVVLLQPKGTQPQPAVHITTTSQTPAPAPVASDTFGLTPEQIAAITQSCTRAAKMTDKVTLRNYGLDEAGQWALLYTDKAALFCAFGLSGKQPNAGSQKVHVNWLAGNYSTDVGGVQPGGDAHPYKPALPGVPGFRFGGGRVDSSVARMTFRYSDGRTAEAKIANGTFMVRLVYPSTWDGVGQESDTTERRAYDAAGNLLDVGSDSEAKCWTMPGTNEVIPDYRPIDVAERDGRKCQPAPPWK